MNATPSTTADAVSAKRNLWASRLFTCLQHWSSPAARHLAPRPFIRRVVHLVHDPAVGQEHHPVGVAGRHRVVGDHTIVWPSSSTDRRMNASTSALARESRLPVGSSAKMISGRETSARADGDPLLLAAGQLGRLVLRAGPEADRVDHRLQPRRVGLAGRRDPGAA